MSGLAPIIIKKCKCPPPASHSTAWKIALADMLMALMAFFLVMWLLEVATPAQRSAIAQYFAQQQVTQAEGSNDAPIPSSRGTSAGIINLGGGLNSSEDYRMEMPAERDSQGDTAEVGTEGSDGQTNSIVTLHHEIATALKDLHNEDVELALEDTIVRLTLASDILYAPGSVDLDGPGLAVVRAATKILKNDFHQIRIEGHSDALGTGKNSEIASNWVLSAQRAANVAAFMSSAGIDGKRIHAIGYGKHRPKAPNITEQGRAKNRRVEIVIGAIYAN